MTDSEADVVELHGGCEIGMFFHCTLCIEEDVWPQELEVGWTEAGVQVWCKRHQRNVIHIDFLGQKIDTR